MAYWNDVWKIINGSNTSVCREDGTDRTIVRDSVRFKELPEQRQSRVNDIICNEQKKRALRHTGTLDSLGDVKKRSAELIPLIVNSQIPPAKPGA
jgi:hypothetical protein